MANIGVVITYMLTNSQLMQSIIVYIGYNCAPIIRKINKYTLKVYWEDPNYVGILTPLV